MKWVATGLIALGLLCFPWQGTARALVSGDDPVISVTVEGVAAVTNGDLGKAEDEALADAKRNAVEQGVGVFVKSESLGKDYVQVEETILTKSEGYLASWEKVEGSRKVESVEGSQLLKIKINAKVKLIKLIDAMSGIEPIYNAMQRPRVMVLIDEENLGRVTKQSAATDAIVREFQKRKFDVVDASVSRKIVANEAKRAEIEGGDAKAAAVLALDEGAEMLVLGSAKSSESVLPYGLGQDAKAASAILNARIVYADTGEILFTAKATQASGTSFSQADEAGTKALDAAGSKLISADSQRFASEVLARWAMEVQNGRVVRLIASGASYGDLVALKKVLRDLRGHVAFVREKFEAKTATVDFKTKMTPSDLCERLSDATIGKKKAEIQRSKGSTINISLQ